MRFRFYLSLIFAKLAYLFLKLTKLSSGTAIIGLITLKFCPNFLEYVSEYIKLAQINITGTNGKTTTSSLLAHILKGNNKKIITNSEGANMLNGIVNTLALQICPFFLSEYAVIETDEAFLEKIYQKNKGDFLLVTNLFEDQVDRFATPYHTKALLQKGIDLNPDVQLVLNADDPISSTLNSKKAPVYYGIENVYEENGNLIFIEDNSQKSCVCGKNLIYTKKFYAQLGHYSCECGQVRPEVKYSADVILHKDFLEIKLFDEIYKAPLTGLYNAYNLLGAIAILKELGIDNIRHLLQSYKVAFGRNEKRVLNDKNVIIKLIKNPAGANETLKTVDLDSNILIAINNNVADGTDISWLNSVDFTLLKDSKNEIIITGMKADEIEKRLKDCGVFNINKINKIADAVSYIGKKSNGDITILPSYTALLRINKIKELKKCY